MSGRLPCAQCERRSLLVERLGARLDVRRLNPERLAATLGLGDRELLRALGVNDEGRLADPERQASEAIGTSPAGGPTWRRLALCRHDPRWPLRRRVPAAGSDSSDGWGPPAILFVVGEACCLRAIHEARAVAIVGGRRPSDYGREVARALAWELACAGVTVVAGLGSDVADAAHAGALEAGGRSIAVMASAADVCQPVVSRPLYRRVVERGCALSELPWGARRRRWCYVGRSRMIAGLAAMVVVVEAEDQRSDLSLAWFARGLGRKVVAVPGRVTSPASSGAHALIVQGAALVRNGADVLDVLLGQREPDGADTGHAGTRPASGAARAGRERMPGIVDTSGRERLAQGSDRPPPASQAWARALLDEVRAGADTLERLLRHGHRVDEVLAGLAELELSGAVVRGDGGRYVPRIGGPAIEPVTTRAL